MRNQKNKMEKYEKIKMIIYVIQLIYCNIFLWFAFIMKKCFFLLLLSSLHFVHRGCRIIQSRQYVWTLEMSYKAGNVFYVLMESLTLTKEVYFYMGSQELAMGCNTQKFLFLIGMIFFLQIIKRSLKEKHVERISKKFIFSVKQQKFIAIGHLIKEKWSWWVEFWKYVPRMTVISEKI